MGNIEVDFSSRSGIGGKREGRECFESAWEEGGVARGTIGDDARSDGVDLVEIKRSLRELGSAMAWIRNNNIEWDTSNDVLHGAPLRMTELTQDVCLASVAKMDAAAVR